MFSPRSVWVLLAIFFAGTANAAPPDPIDPGALQQIQALLQEKRSRTPAQRKIASNILYEAKQRRGVAIAVGVPQLQTGIQLGPNGEIVVDITASVTGSLLDTLQMLGARVLQSHSTYRSIRAEIPLLAVETLAAHPDVTFIQPKQEAMVNNPTSSGAASSARPLPALAGVSSALPEAVRPGFFERAATVRSQLAAALGKTAEGKSASGREQVNKVNTSEGVVTHRANLAMSTFSVTGAGVKVGVLSDGVKSLASLQSSGDLPTVTVLPGQAGPANGDEGTAMLEIVYDMAPGAQLYFATAFNSIASFAQNIKDLRSAGCDIIIDDVSYFVETPFQKGQTPAVASNTNGGLVTQAVNDVTAAGALYFSSAANSGGKSKGTSGTWEGDFVDGGPANSTLLGETGRLHDFDPSGTVTAYDALTASSGNFPALFWSDPLGGSSNDYDLFLLNSSGTSVVGASTDLQNGTQDPLEIINISSLVSGERLVIVKFSGSARFLHLDTDRGRLTFNTQGSTHGHNAPPSANAFSVAATPAAAAFGPPPNPTGPYPNPFNSSNTIERFSSDGPRHYFFNANSSAITPGNFSSSGGVILQKPDITAADGVSCATPGFDPFYGTSAAAPHAGAIAALVKSRNLSLSASQISSYLTSTAIDIEAAGWDRDSGFGILDAYSAVQAAVPTAVRFYTLTPCRLVDTRGANAPAISVGVDRTFLLSGLCGVPADATTLSVNVTVTLPSAGGDLRMFGGPTLPPTSIINYRGGQTRANNAIVQLGPGASVTVHADQPSGTAQFILDVNGYFK